MAQNCENADLIGVLVIFRCHIEASQPAQMPQKRYMGLTQIDLIKQIYDFFCGFRDFCEILLFLSQMALMPQKGIWVSHRLI